MRHLLLLVTLLAGCGGKGEPDPPSPPFHYDLPADLAEKSVSYRNLVPSVQDQWGFVGTARCDSLLMTALLGAAGVPIADIHAAENPLEPGKWSRRPEFRDGTPEPCFPGNSGSSSSRDMTLGLLWFSWATKDRDIMENLWQYAADHGWQIGEGDQARTGLRTLRGTLAAEIRALGGESRPVDELVTDPQLIANDGYAAHLQIMHILLRGEIYGELSPWARHQIRTLADANPRSPIMQAAAARWIGGGYEDRFLAAARAPYWPANRLPTSLDRCGDWLTAEDDKDWLPCDENEIFSGGDLLFATWIFTKE